VSLTGASTPEPYTTSEIAEANARKALRLSPDPSCGKPPAVPPIPLDTDGDGIPDAVDKCPNDPEDKDGFQDQDGCPDLDNDQDGIPDAVDKCPNDPEDKDGFEDEDGCPDLDNDQDGIPDKTDQCPNEPGTPEEKRLSQETHPGLSDPGEDRVAPGGLLRYGQGDYLAAELCLLDEVGEVLKMRPTMQVRVEGHTDSRGSQAHNMLLSQARGRFRQGIPCRSRHRHGSAGRGRVWF